MSKFSKQVNKAKREAGQPTLPEKSEDQLNFERKVRIKELNRRLDSLTRHFNFKTEQVISGQIIETRSIHQIPDGSAVKVDGYIGGLKPKFLLEDEIEEIKFHMELLKEQIEMIQKNADDTDI